MFKLDNDFLISLGLGSLPVDEKNRLLQVIYERLEMNVGMRLAEKMSDQQLDEFESFIDRNDEAGALRWLETNFPNYKDVVAEELEKLKKEVAASAPQILAAAQNQAAQNQGANQQPQQPMQPGSYQQPQAQPQMQPPQPFQPTSQPNQAYGQPSQPYGQFAQPMPSSQQPYSEPAAPQFQQMTAPQSDNQPAAPAQPVQSMSQQSFGQDMSHVQNPTNSAPYGSPNPVQPEQQSNIGYDPSFPDQQPPAGPSFTPGQ